MSERLLSEDRILERIDRFFPDAALSPGVGLGRGDDCAVLEDGPLCVSTDLFLEDVHFRRAYFGPEDTGWKALAVNLSDLAGMGAVPAGFTLGLALPPDADMGLLDGLCRGMAEASCLPEVPVPLIGGDLSRGERLHLCLTVFGRTPRPLKRREALPGDVIFMIGRTGLARAGLLALESTLLPGGPTVEAVRAAWPGAVAAHLRPLPRLAEGARLSALAAALEREGGKAVRLGLMDLSDGLARDLPRLLGPGKGASIRLPRAHPEIGAFLRQSDADPDREKERLLRHLCLGGEDYALIGTCEPRLAAQVMVNAAEGAFLGHVTDEPAFFCEGLPGDFRGGFDHFG